MSVDTRRPRPPGGRSPGFDEEPVLSTVKVPSDPAQVIVNHASFRVQLASPVVRKAGANDETARLSAVRAGPSAAAGTKRRTPVVWSGRTEPGNAAASQLFQAVRKAEAAGAPPLGAGGDAGATQVLPRIGVDDGPPTVIGPRTSPQGPPVGPLLKGVRPARGAYDDDPPYGPGDDDGPAEESAEAARQRQNADAVRHAYYPGRRMNLGVVLLPLRIFLGFISIYAGMGKLCDPVYFDGGERGSMVTWLHSLHPWAVASPLRDFALAHPVGSGLTVAFLQVLVGVLTIFGLWQRLAASVGALLSAALIVTVSWRTVPVYDAPDIIYLAAWSPLVIAGAPVYSVDGRLASEAWRRLGPRVPIWDLRRRVLRRGAVMVAVVGGLTLLAGSVLGGAVRSSEVTTVPGPSEPPRNHLPGSPLPQRPGTERSSVPSASAGAGSPEASRSASPSATTRPTARPGAVRETTSVGSAGERSATRPGGAVRTPPRRQPVAPPPPSRTAGPTSTGGSGGSSATSGGSGGTTGGSASTGGGSGGSGGSSTSGGALGGLLG
ncbi:DoxX family membrane protein [Streptomyces sp. URMC 123]|uniref:DoxX family protein n=1 Tax=Streptomyces sp. URMC 123 TaxID=3423403 RepID=UPI003F1AB5B2